MMKRYSASGIKTYESCKLKYHLHYNKEIKIDKIISADTSFGLVIHEIAENYTGKNYPELLEIVNKYKNDLDKEFKNILPTTIDNMFNWLRKYSKFESKNEQELELKTDDYWIYGLADKIFEKNKMFVDYKTAKSNFRENHLFQMQLYNLILSKKWNCDPSKIKCIIYYPRINEEDKILFNNTQIEIFEKSLKKTILDIETNTKWLPTKGYHCRWCEYKESGHCPIQEKK